LAKKTKNIAIFAEWSLYKNESMNCYYCQHTNYVYLEYISSIFQKVFLITPIIPGSGPKGMNQIRIKNIEIIEVPYSSSFLKSQKNILSYYKIIKNLSKKVDTFYCRVPDPFSWMPRIVFGKKTIMHFVGDAIDAAKNNEKWSRFKKTVMIMGYFPDFFLTIFAAKRSTVFTNGYHISHKLKKYSVKAKPVISSTVRNIDLIDKLPPIKQGVVNLIYIGYLRHSKGIRTLMEIIDKMVKKHMSFIFNIVGSGEMENEFAQFVKENNYQQYVILHGHVENRERLNELLKQSDLFIFPSLSEGSPRVIIEAMAQGVPVISTPVGACPYIFADGQEIRYFSFNNPEQALGIINEFFEDKAPFDRIRRSAHEKVNNHFTVNSFLTEVFESCDIVDDK